MFEWFLILKVTIKSSKITETLMYVQLYWSFENYFFQNLFWHIRILVLQQNFTPSKILTIQKLWLILYNSYR